MIEDWVFVKKSYRKRNVNYRWRANANWLISFLNFGPSILVPLRIAPQINKHRFRLSSGIGLLLVFWVLWLVGTSFGATHLPGHAADLTNFFPEDSLKSKNDSLVADSTVKTKTDTVALSKDALEDPVKYKAKDSLRFEVDSEKVYLWGEAEVIFGATSLKAGHILMDMKNDLVYAYGIPDSAGKMSQFPEFTDGAQNFKSKRMMYNIKTKKGKIYEVDTQEGEGYLHGEAVKKDSNDVVYMSRGRYTTCNLDHPHYYFGLKKLKVIPDDKIVTGPANLVIGDIPTPLALPFGFFPNHKGRSSGIIIPQYGEAANIGFFLKDGGYYFGINDYVDLTIKGDIYTRGSYGLRAASSYVQRYAYQGDVSFSYANIKIGEEGFPNYQLNKDFFVRWKHAQDPKSRPNSRFSADVNAGSSNYNKFNSANTTDLLSNTFQSTIRYDYTVPNKPINFSLTGRQSQNTINRTVDITLPEANLLVSRFFLFKRKDHVGPTSWYQNITSSYTGKLANQLSTGDSLLFAGDIDWDRNLRNGISHNIPLTTQIKMLKYFTFSPTINYTESWYLRSIQKNYDPVLQQIQVDTLRGFSQARDLSFSTQLRTVLYGMYQLKGGPVKAFRHAMTPTIGFTYNPGITKNLRVQSGAEGKVVEYSRFEGSLFGAPNAKERGDLNFSLVNNIEMKVKSSSDSITGYKKVKIFDNISFDGNYNFLADSFNLSAININARSQPLDFLFFNFTSQLNPYALDEVSGRLVDQYQWDKMGTLGRLTSASMAVGLNLRSKNAAPVTQSSKASAEELAQVNSNREAYVDFNIPWSLNVSYNFIYSKPAFETTITQALSFTGDINVTDKWKVGFNSGYDLKMKQFTYTSMNIYRDLHCWEMRFNFIPFGFRKSYSLDINVKASILQDLKLSRKRDWYDLR